MKPFFMSSLLRVFKLTGNEMYLFRMTRDLRNIRPSRPRGVTRCLVAPGQKIFEAPPTSEEMKSDIRRVQI